MLCAVGILVLLVVNTAYATQADERVDNAVEIKLYPMSESDWSTAKSDAFKTAVADETTSYCNTSASACALNAAATFTSSEVGISSTTDDSKSMKLTLYVDYPGSASSSGSPDFVVPSSALEVILENARDAIKDDTDAYVTYVGTEYYGIPPDTTANAVIVPLAIFTVIIVGIIAIILVRWQTNKEREDRKAANLMQKKTGGSDYGTSGTQQYNILETTNSTIMTTTTPRVGSDNGNKVSPDNYSNYHSEKETSKSKTGRIITHHESPRNINIQGSEVEMKNGSLPPLDKRDEMTEAELQEKKKRKKERRREKRKLREQELEMYDNQAFDTSNLTEDESRENNVATFSVKQEAIA